MTETTSAPTRKATPAATPRKPRGEYAKSKETRTAILDAALEVFAQSGYRAGSLREVAERVGMSEAGLLHHFRSKSALLLALARFNAAQPGIVELYCTLSAEATSPTHPAHEYFVNRYRFVRDSITGAFRRVAAAGRLAEGIDPDRAAVNTIALMDGLQVQWLLDPASTDMAEALHDVFRSMIRGYDLVSIEQALDGLDGTADASADGLPAAAETGAEEAHA